MRPEWAQRNRLLRAAETLTGDELAKVQDAMRRADPSGGLEKCWQGKELLRKLLKLAGTSPDRGRIFNVLTAFYLHCADSEIAQLRRLAWTVHAWQNSIIAGLHTGISNGRTEGYNRIVKHIGRSRVPQSGQPEAADTLRLHPEIPGVNQQRGALLTLKSRND